jgi:hypothetical protein
MFICMASGSYSKKRLENVSISLQCIVHIRVDSVITFLINLVMSSLNVLFHSVSVQKMCCVDWQWHI